MGMMAYMSYIGVLLLKRNSSVQDLQAYKTYKRTRMLGLCLYKSWDFLIEL
jgi:hypothetical protein